MGLDQSRVPSPPRLPHLLIVEHDVAITERIVRTLEDRRLDVDYDLCISHRTASSKLLASPYQVVIGDAQLSEADDCFLLTRTQTLHPVVPFVTMASASAKESARRLLKEGAFDLITSPLDHEQAVSTILLALWQSKLMNLIACNEKALGKYDEHIKAYPCGSEMETFFKRTLSAIEASIRTYEKVMWRVEDRPIGFSNFARAVEFHTKRRALERLDELGT